mgnify:CR=1 FL=1
MKKEAFAPFALGALRMGVTTAAKKLLKPKSIGKAVKSVATEAVKNKATSAVMQKSPGVSPAPQAPKASAPSNPSPNTFR